MLTLPTLLCVDDESSILEALQRVLKNDFKVFSVESVSSALTFLEKESVQIVLTDLQMPGESGIELLHQIRSLYPEIARCVLSGQVTLGELSDQIDKGTVHKFILKPWDSDQLILQMKEAFQLHLVLKERESLSRLSITDPVTQLTNHRFFQEQLKKYYSQCSNDNSPLSLVMVDVDYFKSYNDHCGHPEGDRLLQLIASRLLELCPSSGYVSRYGGEEFALIIPMPAEQVLGRANEIQANFEENPFVGPNGRPAYITVSVGVSTLNQKIDSAEHLIYKADQALFRAKRQGRNQVVADF